MKRFSPMRDTQRGSELHEKEEREEGDRDEQEETKGDSRGERQIYAGVCSQSVLIAQTPTKIHRTGLGREGGRRK